MSPRVSKNLLPRTGRLAATVVGLALALVGPALAADNKLGDSTGEQIYRLKCASCHGAAGEGTKEFPRALEGDKSVAKLARLIEKTMPEDDPGTCVGPEAEKVAAYIHEAFYSQAARERNVPPRVELSRLTVRQHKNALADLIGAFRGDPARDGKPGLRADYFKASRFRDNERIIERVDPEVKFDFKSEGPGPEPGKFDARRFSVRWQGSVIAPETGEYEFIIRTEHAARLFVNDPRKPLIDAWVKSGSDTEYRASITLMGGRAYPIHLDFTKGSQGVNDAKFEKHHPILPATIALEWSVPNRSTEVIPARCLTTVEVPPTFVSLTPFPPDDRSEGYERGTSVSKAWEQATTDAAIETAAYVSDHLRELTDVKPDDSDRADKLKAFCRTFVRRAFRGPISDDLVAAVINRQFEGGRDPEVAVKRVILLTLKSPRFLYREAGGLGPGFDVASRLSFGLWDSIPDRTLIEAAEAGKLADKDEVARQATRMVDDPRAHTKIREFFFQWLRIDRAPDLSKDPEIYPGFDKAIAADLRTSLDLTLDDILWSDSSDFRQVLLADQSMLNGRLSKFYGAGLADDAPFQKTRFEADRRAGVLSHPYVLANFAYTASSSPIHRGVFINRSVLGRGLKPPPEAVAPLAPSLHAGLSTRERVTIQTSPAACMTCHGMVNPLGFGLEQFDAVGRFRAEEKGKPVDASGSYEDQNGTSTPYEGARALAELLARSEETHSAFVDQLFHALVKQPIRAFGPKTRADLRRGFAEDGYSVRKLAARIVATSAMSPAPEPAAPPSH
jgi:mono/diheme cytochrome c family protein